MTLYQIDHRLPDALDDERRCRETREEELALEAFARHAPADMVDRLRDRMRSSRPFAALTDSQLLQLRVAAQRQHADAANRMLAFPAIDPHDGARARAPRTRRTTTTAIAADNDDEDPADDRDDPSPRPLTCPGCGSSAHFHRTSKPLHAECNATLARAAALRLRYRGGQRG